MKQHWFSDSTKEAFLKDLTGSLLEVGWHVRGKYGPLACITSVVGATKMLLWFPTIPQDIYPLMKDRSLVPHVSHQTHGLLYSLTFSVIFNVVDIMFAFLRLNLVKYDL